MSISSGENLMAPATWINGHDTGCVLKERYALREVRGAGGFATVYRAKDLAFTVLEVSVAVKLAHDKLNVKNRRRFEREANVAAQLNHPNIVRVLDYGVLDGRPWFVMPLLQGHSLQLRRGGHWLDMSRLMQQLCSAVHAMHLGTALSQPGLRTQVLHRDIKPLNCFVTEREHCEPHLTLLDLGLCKLPDVQRLTSAGTAVGTSSYMAPECIIGAVPSTIRSEIYALGVTFFELLTGELPDPTHRIRGLTDDTVQAPDPRTLRPELPADLAAIVMRAMAPQLSRRFPDVGAMMTAIAAVLGRVGVRRAPPAHQREGLAPIIPLHPVPHVELASESTVLKADTDLEPAAIAPGAQPARLAVPTPEPAEPVAVSELPAVAFEAQPPAVAEVAPEVPAQLAVPAPINRPRRWFIAASIALAAGATALALRPVPPADLPVEQPTADLRVEHALPRAPTTPTRPAALPVFVPPPSAPAQGTLPPVKKASRLQARVAPTAEDAATIQAAIQTSAEAAVPALRGCPDAPNSLSAQLQVHQKRGTVLMVDGEPVDDLNPWHTCVRRELGRIEYPRTSTPVKARIRLPLR
jgi:serine/threonine protein kinase